MLDLSNAPLKGSWASDRGSSPPAPGYGLAKTDRVCMSYVVRLCLMRVGMLGSKIIMGVLLDETLKEYSVILTTIFYGMNQKI